MQKQWDWVSLLKNQLYQFSKSYYYFYYYFQGLYLPCSELFLSFAVFLVLLRLLKGMGYFSSWSGAVKYIASSYY